MRPIFHTFFVIASMLIAGCVSQSETHKNSERASYDSTLASALYESETNFLDRLAAEDAYGMARAAKARVRLIGRLDPSNPATDRDTLYRQSEPLKSTLMASVRDMVAEAKTVAAGDENTLRQIEELFPSSMISHADEIEGLRGFIGGLREVKLTIGLEVEATLAALEKETIKLPVNGSVGTTVYAQPVGHQYIETTADISMTVSRYTQDLEAWETVSCPTTSKTRLPCFIPAGNHNEIEISLHNNGAASVDILIFISGNAEMAAAAMARDEFSKPNRLDDE